MRNCIGAREGGADFFFKLKSWNTQGSKNFKKYIYINIYFSKKKLINPINFKLTKKSPHFTLSSSIVEKLQRPQDF